jgi:hypothetical protein
MGINCQDRAAYSVLFCFQLQFAVCRDQPNGENCDDLSKCSNRQKNDFILLLDFRTDSLTK